MAAKTKYVKLEECRKCKHHKGETKNYAKCGMHEGAIGTALIAPSNRNPGIRNGAMAVRCHNVK